MKNPRILSIQDISCFGQCSLTVALPVLSALGVETAILPTAILSTHTSGFTGFTFRDLQEDLLKVKAHWEKEQLSFDAVYTGYLGRKEDVDAAIDIGKGKMNRGPLIVDPAFGDHGKLYPGFDEEYVDAMRALSKHSDVLLPNLTEAYALLGEDYLASPDEAEIKRVVRKLVGLGAKAVVLKGVGAKAGETGIVVYDGETEQRYSHPRLEQDFHGTGDVFASVFVGAYIKGHGLIEAGKIAADFVCECIRNTAGDPNHAYGVRFEPLLGGLAAKVNE